MPKIKAAATLPVVLLIGGLIVEIGIAGAFMAYYLAQSGLGVKLSEEALAAGRAGIQDAKIRIVRNKSFAPSPNPYTLTVGNRMAQITVCKELKTVSTACDTAMTGKYEITSLGMALTKRRQVQSIISVDSLTGEVKIESEKEIAI
ncbi:MAG: hypothetical protein Q8N28_01250 [bacterium]|nr:hypothetical protein [bacterium]